MPVGRARPGIEQGRGKQSSPSPLRPLGMGGHSKHKARAVVEGRREGRRCQDLILLCFNVQFNCLYLSHVELTTRPTNETTRQAKLVPLPRQTGWQVTGGWRRVTGSCREAIAPHITFWSCPTTGYCSKRLLMGSMRCFGHRIARLHMKMFEGMCLPIIAHSLQSQSRKEMIAPIRRIHCA